MAGATVSVRVKDEGVRDLFRRMKARGRDMTPAMKVVGEIVRSSVVRNFEEGGRPRWKPSRKAKGKTLIKSGRLMASISRKAYRDRAEVGTNAVYAAIHQFGFEGTVGVRAHRRKVRSRDVREGKRIKARGVGFVRAHERDMKVPARPFLKVQDEDMREIRAGILAHIMKEVR